MSEARSGYSARTPSGSRETTAYAGGTGFVCASGSAGSIASSRNENVIAPTTSAICGHAVRAPVRRPSAFQAACRPSAASGTSAVTSSAIQRDGTRNAGMSSHSTRVGGHVNSRPNTLSGVGRPKSSDVSTTPARPAVAIATRPESSPPAPPGDDEPAECERDGEEADVVLGLGRIRAVTAALVVRLEPVTDEQVLRGRDDELVRTEAEDREVADLALEPAARAHASGDACDRHQHRRGEGRARHAEDEAQPAPAGHDERGRERRRRRRRSTP